MARRRRAAHLGVADERVQVGMLPKQIEARFLRNFEPVRKVFGRIGLAGVRESQPAAESAPR